MTLFLKSRFLSAVKSGKTEKVKDYLNKGADPNSTSRVEGSALMIAAVYGHTEIVDILLEHGVDVNQASNISGIGPGNVTENFTPLMAACGDGSGKVEIVERLLRAGAQVNALDSDGFCSLMGAVTFGHLEIVKVLIKAGANVKLRYGSGKHIYTLIDVAKENKFTEIVDTLIAAGAPEK